MYKLLDSPLSVHLELTTSCNQKCLHCYNFWRSDNNFKHVDLSHNNLIHIVNQLAENKVFHVILTGGEPLLNSDILFTAMEKLSEREISFSLNSNAILMNSSVVKRLKERGLNSILISLLSNEVDSHEYLANRKNTFDLIVKGITECVENEIRVSVNMVVSKVNLEKVFDVGMFVKKLEVRNFNATRVISPRIFPNNFPSNLELDRHDVYRVIEQLMKLHHVGMNVDSLVPYPFCSFTENEPLMVLGGRTCSAGKTSIAIACDGSVRACPHLEFAYGNILEKSLEEVWLEMTEWRNGSLIPEKCKRCGFLAKCGGGCRVASKDGMLSGEDFAMSVPVLEVNKSQVSSQILNIGINQRLKVRKPCRFRKDKVLGVINTGGIRNTFVSHQTFNLLLGLYLSQIIFTPKKLKLEHKIEMSDKDYLEFLSRLVEQRVLEKI